MQLVVNTMSSAPFPFSFSVPFAGKHCSTVIGTKCIIPLQQEFGVNIRASKVGVIIEGEEKPVLYAALKVYSLLSLAMAQSVEKLENEVTLGKGEIFPTSLYP